MKKSKIIVPALGIILLSTVASVTGTVAWFTANTKFTTEVSQFEVARLQGDLTCDITNVVGTTITADKKINLVTDTDYKSQFTDASVDVSAATTAFWTKADRTQNNDTGFRTTAEDATASGLEGADATYTGVKDTTNKIKYYYYVAWNMTFHYQFPNNPTKTNELFLNVSGASGDTSLITAVSGTIQDKDAAKGLRLAFVNGANKIVWADNSTVATHVASATTTAEYTASGSGVNFISGHNTALYSDSTKLGEFALPSAGQSSTDVTINCFAWFEGSDKTNIANDTNFTAIKAALHFVTRQKA